MIELVGEEDGVSDDDGVSEALAVLVSVGVPVTPNELLPLEVELGDDVVVALVVAEDEDVEEAVSVCVCVCVFVGVPVLVAVPLPVFEDEAVPLGVNVGECVFTGVVRMNAELRGGIVTPRNTEPAGAEPIVVFTRLTVSKAYSVLLVQPYKMNVPVDGFTAPVME